MKFIVKRKEILTSIQYSISLLRGCTTLPILNNLLLQAQENYLLLTGSDLEIEIMSRVTLYKLYEIGDVTVPARKFYDIFRSLPEEAEVSVKLKNERILLYSKYSKYSLSTLPSLEFPRLDSWQTITELILSQSTLKTLIESIKFSMANQDVRYYLNGMFFDIRDRKLYTVATDGYRLSMCTVSVCLSIPSCSFIVPRKGVIELAKMLDNSADKVKLKVGRNNICAVLRNCTITSKLIDGRFPDYLNVFPKNPDKVLEINRITLKQALVRVAILSNDKFHTVKFILSNNQLNIHAHNAEQEEAEEVLNVNYQGQTIEIGLNVNYLLDVLGALKCENVRLLFTDATSSIQIEGTDNRLSTYLIMPIRL